MNHSTIASTLARGLHLSVAVALLAGLLAITQPAQADDLVVTLTFSLRDAITQANSTIGSDTITFAAETNGIPIVLTGAAGDDANVSGDLDILVNGDLIIQGNGPGNTIVDGGMNDRLKRQPPRTGVHHLAGHDGAFFDRLVFDHLPARPLYGSGDTGPHPELIVGSVNDSLGIGFGDVTSNNLNDVRHILTSIFRTITNI